MERDALEAILDLDKKTGEMLASYAEKEKTLIEETANFLIQEENRFNEEARREGEEAFQRILKEGREKTSRIDEENRKNLEKIEARYDEYEEKLLERAFQRFVLNNG